MPVQNLTSEDLQPVFTQIQKIYDTYNIYIPTELSIAINPVTAENNPEDLTDVTQESHNAATSRNFDILNANVPSTEEEFVNIEEQYSVTSYNDESSQIPPNDTYNNDFVVLNKTLSAGSFDEEAVIVNKTSAGKFDEDAVIVNKPSVGSVKNVVANQNPPKLNAIEKIEQEFAALQAAQMAMFEKQEETDLILNLSKQLNVLLEPKEKNSKYQAVIILQRLIDILNSGDDIAELKDIRALIQKQMNELIIQTIKKLTIEEQKRFYKTLPLMDVETKIYILLTDWNRFTETTARGSELLDLIKEIILSMHISDIQILFEAIDITSNLQLLEMILAICYQSEIPLSFSVEQLETILNYTAHRASEFSLMIFCIALKHLEAIPNWKNYDLQVNGESLWPTILKNNQYVDHFIIDVVADPIFLQRWMHEISPEGLLFMVKAAAIAAPSPSLTTFKNAIQKSVSYITENIELQHANSIPKLKELFDYLNSGYQLPFSFEKNLLQTAISGLRRSEQLDEHGLGNNNCDSLKLQDYKYTLPYAAAHTLQYCNSRSKQTILELLPAEELTIQRGTGNNVKITL